MAFVRWLFRLSWYDRQPAYVYRCENCEGAGMVDLPTGLPDFIETANSMPCGDCAGMGRYWTTHKKENGKVFNG